MKEITLICFFLSISGCANFAAPLFSRTRTVAPTPTPRPVPTSRPVGTPTPAPGSLGNPAPVENRTATLKVDENYLVRPGDVLSFTLAEDRKPPVELSVMASGEVDAPYVGRYAVSGKTCKIIATELKTRLEASFYRKATVTVSVNRVVENLANNYALSALSTIRVYFTGAVRAEGVREFPADQKITVSKAILISGGFADFANKKKVQLIRRQPDGSSTITTVNVNDLLLGKRGADPQVESEDLIRVPERLINF